MRTYGNIALVGNEWVIDAEAHVVIRLKRLFARLAQAAKELRLRHTPDVARDLEWFMERYPLEISAEHRAYLEQGSVLHVERAERFVRVLSGATAARAFTLAVPARDYQQVAADLALQQHGLLIADDVGVGKTCSAICTLTEPTTRPALVVTLTALPKQWGKEIGRFAPKLRTHVLKKATPYPLPDCDVIITSYSKISGWAPALVGKVNSVIFDEVQELRHEGSARYTAATEIAHAAEYRIGLSATPIYNHGDEFYNVLQVLRPDALGTKAEFHQEWCGAVNMNGNASVRDPRAFGAYLRDQGLMIRRTRKEVGRELPGLTIVPHTVESEDVLKSLGGDITELAKFILDREGAPLEQMQARGELDWKLRQATGISKAGYVAEFVKLLIESGEERVLLYGWHHAVYDMWSEKLTAAGIASARFTGEESPAAKEKSLDAFKSGGAKVLMMSLRAGAGLDGLQYVCRTVVFGELDWSPGVHEQCTGRVARDGQPDPVVAYYLVSEEGSDPVIQSALGIKRMQIEGVRSPGEFEIAESVKREGILDLARSVLKRKKPPQLALGGEAAQ